MCLRPATVAALLLVTQTFSGTQAKSGTQPEDKVSFIVGDYLPAEGGSWDAASSPLNRPFGIAFFRMTPCPSLSWKEAVFSNGDLTQACAMFRVMGRRVTAAMATTCPWLPTTACTTVR